MSFIKIRIVVVLSVCLIPFLATANDAYSSGKNKIYEMVISADLDELRRAILDFPALDEDVWFDQPALIYAARNFDNDRFEIIAKGHRSLDIVDDTGTSAVMHALMAGRIENAKLLHQIGASLEGISDQGYTVRVLAEEVGLQDFGPEYPVSLPAPQVDEDDANTLLLLAAEAGDTPLIDWAIKLGADLSAKAGNGLQAAHLAALGGHEDTFNHILTHEAAPREWATIRAASANDKELGVVDFIIAGEGGSDHGVALDMLQTLRTAYPDLFRKDTDLVAYRDAMENIGYSPGIIDALLPPTALPPITYDLPELPAGPDATPEDWRVVQRVLRDANLYKGKIDGIPGPATFAAVYEYVVALEDQIVDRAVEAARRGAGNWLGDTNELNSDRAVLYGQTDFPSYGSTLLGQFTTRQTDLSRQIVPHGYFMSVSPTEPPGRHWYYYWGQAAEMEPAPSKTRTGIAFGASLVIMSGNEDVERSVVIMEAHLLGKVFQVLRLPNSTAYTYGQYSRNRAHLRGERNLPPLIQYRIEESNAYRDYPIVDW